MAPPLSYLKTISLNWRELITDYCSVYCPALSYMLGTRHRHITGTCYHRWWKSLLTRFCCCSWSSLTSPDLSKASNYTNNENHFLAFSLLIWKISHQLSLRTTIPSLTPALAGKNISLYLKRKLSSKISSLEGLRSRDLMLKILGQDFLL